MTEIMEDLKTKGRVTVGMQTELISDMISEHAQAIGFIRSNEYLDVVSVDVEGNKSSVSANLKYKEMN